MTGLIKTLIFLVDSIMGVDHYRGLELGAGSYYSGEVYVNNWTGRYKVRVGKYCSIAWGVRFMLDGEHDTSAITTFPLSKVTKHIDRVEANGRGDIVIGNDVWIGFESVIMSGVHIGDGAVVGARSVVTRDVQDYEIVAGNPARHIRYRFSEPEIRKLKALRWWDWPGEDIREYQHLLQSGDIDRLCNYCILGGE